MKSGNQNKTDKPSTTADVLKTFEKLHSLPGLVIKHRSESKLLSTNIKPFIHLQRESGEPGVLGALNRIYPQWNDTSTRTGRLSATKPNIMNVSKLALLVLSPFLSIPSSTPLSHLLFPQVPGEATLDINPRDTFGCTADG